MAADGGDGSRDYWLTRTGGDFVTAYKKKRALFYSATRPGSMPFHRLAHTSAAPWVLSPRPSNVHAMEADSIDRGK